MPSVNFRQLRDTRQLSAWLDAGEVVELRKRNRIIARIVPESPQIKPSKADWPDFETRLKRIYGDRVLPAVAELIEDRNSRF
jgi:antitoxin (DNA-binding transcriptional repressor) of toxin-antitoxin stability system